MAEIKNMQAVNYDEYKQTLSAFDDHELLAQELTIQGALHMISTLLRKGVTEQNALNILKALKEQTAILRAEYSKRETAQAFTNDQTNFH